MMQEQTANLPGSMVDGRYQIIESLGQGDMAHVYLAIDQKNGANVAIKVMHDDLSNDPVFIKRFEIEAKATSSLNHPNIVRVIGFGQDHEHRYIVREFFEGRSLKELINTSGAIAWQTAVPMAIQIGLALEYAHEHGLVHRDIKPHNILITKDMLAKVTDFVIAQVMTSNMITLTSGISFGSVHYYSPEKARGSITGETSDIYSLGVLMYEMVTGRVPFDGDTAVTIAIKHLQEIPPQPSLINRTIPRGLDQIIMKCIQKSPDNRYQNARELVDELDELLINPNGVFGIVAGLPDRNGPTTAIQAISPEPNYSKLREIEQTILQRRHLRHRGTAIVMAIILAAIIFLTSIGAWSWNKLSASMQTEGSNQSYELSNYIGRELTEVLWNLEKDNILVDVLYSENPTVIVGLITDQIPISGEVIRKADVTLTLTVSSGPELQVIPDLSGQTSAKARTELTNTFGFNVTIIYENARVDQGKVVRTIPAVGQRLPQGANIILVVSNGMPLVMMPDLVGMTLSDARALIEISGLVLGPVVSIAGDVPEDKRIVIRQSAPAGSGIEDQSIINITYGTAQDYANFRNPTPTPIQYIIMPDLAQMSLDSMKTRLTNLGLKNITLSYLSAESALLPEAQLFVIEQLPAAGTQIKLTDSVQILAGSMVEYNAFKNPTPTPEPTPEPTPAPTTTAPTTTAATTTAPTTTAATTTAATTTPTPEPTPTSKPKQTSEPTTTTEPTTTQSS